MPVGYLTIIALDQVTGSASASGKTKPDKAVHKTGSGLVHEGRLLNTVTLSLALVTMAVQPQRAIGRAGSPPHDTKTSP